MMWIRIFLAFALILAQEEISALYSYGGEGAKPAGENILVPEIEAISPNWGPSDMKFTITIKGKHLKGLQEVRFSPPIGIEVGNPPLVNKEGSLATVEITIMGHAPLGLRLVTLVTPAGESTETPTEANIFRISFAHIH
jgi:hypothetical protein